MAFMAQTVQQRSPHRAVGFYAPLKEVESRAANINRWAVAGKKTTHPESALEIPLPQPLMFDRSRRNIISPRHQTGSVRATSTSPQAQAYYGDTNLVFVDHLAQIPVRPAYSPSWSKQKMWKAKRLEL